jgi:predicted nuclease with RNAse H fold/dephospho-CoA kinase
MRFGTSIDQSLLALKEPVIAPSKQPKSVKPASPQKSRPAKPMEPGSIAALEDPASVLFLDIETTGLSWYYDEITIVGWLRDGAYSVHLAGDSPAPLLDSLRTALALVTFNGTQFDLRFLRKAFPELVLPPVHLDLRYLAKRAGLTGGQKAIELELGISQRANVEDIDGAMAVLLWHRYLRGDEWSLRRLIDYNRCDVVGMCGILDDVLDRLDTHPDLWFSRPRFAARGHVSSGLARPSSVLPRVRNLRATDNTFHSLFGGTPAELATVVGIDLTGSEKRPSGWCLSRGPETETAMVSSDDELFERVMAARPAIVSIDSPLSLPFGRSRVEDDDPSRDEFGIMRQCERELKRRGINVYPCLLPSMQGLTRRGMQLAARLRVAGVPVIESYPGAAQDIMGIPRKGAGQDFLKQGLEGFGIRGNFVCAPVRHDELDAITSALVGSFFLAGKYEALGGPSEAALIVPNLKADSPSRLVVGISGRICAGKTTVARMLEAHGFAYTRFSLVIDDEISARGGIPDRNTRQNMGLEINRKRGQRWLCDKVLERVADQERIVVDGLRFPEDHAFFAEQFGLRFMHVHIVALDSNRAIRYSRAEPSGPPFADADTQLVETKVDDLAGLAAVVLENDSTIDALETAVNAMLETLCHGKSGQCQSLLS